MCEYVFTGAELEDPFVGMTPLEVAALTKAACATNSAAAIGDVGDVGIVGCSSCDVGSAEGGDDVEVSVSGGHAAMEALTASLANTPADIAPESDISDETQKTTEKFEEEAVTCENITLEEKSKVQEGSGGAADDQLKEFSASTSASTLSGDGKIVSE